MSQRESQISVLLGEISTQVTLKNCWWGNGYCKWFPSNCL